MQVEIGWGERPRVVQVPAGSTVLRPPPGPPPAPWEATLNAALDAPFGTPPLDLLLARRPSVCVLVPDETRKDVARFALPVLERRLTAAGISFTVGVAGGKHPPGAGPAGAWHHDARSPALVVVGHTAWGTEVRYPRAALEADLRIVVGEIRPHYFAGYAGGAKGIFPGVAGEAGIWHNHTLKAAPGARLGRVDGNPCRADLEAAAALAGPAFLLNVVRGARGLVTAVAGDLVAAHREGVRRARPLFEIEAPPPAAAVVVSDQSPVTMNLYQACKLLPPAGPLLAPGGTIILAAACHAGLGPVPVINEAIYRLGVVHALPPDHRVVLVSEHPASTVAPSFCEWAPTVEAALAALGDPPAHVLPYGGDLVPRPRVETSDAGC